MMYEQRTLNFDNDMELDEIIAGINVFLARKFDLTDLQLDYVNETLEEIAEDLDAEENFISVDFDTQELDDISTDVDLSNGTVTFTEFF